MTAISDHSRCHAATIRLPSLLPSTHNSSGLIVLRCSCPLPITPPFGDLLLQPYQPLRCIPAAATAKLAEAVEGCVEAEAPAGISIRWTPPQARPPLPRPLPLPPTSLATPPHSALSPFPRLLSCTPLRPTVRPRTVSTIRVLLPPCPCPPLHPPSSATRRCIPRLPPLPSPPFPALTIPRILIRTSRLTRRFPIRRRPSRRRSASPAAAVGSAGVALGPPLY